MLTPMNAVASAMRGFERPTSVAETDEEMCALLAGAAQTARQSLSFLLPVRRAALLRCCVAQGFRSSRPMALMTIGEYREPQKPYCPSVNY
jgi:hypothetical protein